MATPAATVTAIGGPPVGPARTPPTPLTGFVGREAELGELHLLLEAGRLLTLTGGGGSGKTRLASELVRRFSSDFPDGVAWIDLAELDDGDLLARHVSAELGLVEEQGRAETEALSGRLSGLEMLLVLDNCEHLVAACAGLCQTLLEACAGLKVLATSREALGIGGETAWLVPPLSLPAEATAAAVADIERAEAVQLFVQRARAVRSGFALDATNAAAVAQICRTLDGIPLALELAAARVKVLSPEQIASRLDDVFALLVASSRTALPRHRTLREAIDWSYELLEVPEQVLFRRVCVFRGGWTLDAAERVCSDDALPTTAVLDRLSALVDKSLVRSELAGPEARFTLLEPVRQYGAELAERSGECETMHARHAAYFRELAESTEPHIRGGTRHTPWMARLEAEHANLRAAFERLGEGDAGIPERLRLDVALLWFHFCLGLFREPRARITEGLARVPELEPRLHGQALTALGYQAIWLGDYAAAYEPLAAGAELLRTADDPDALSLALTGLGSVIGLGGDAPAAFACFDEAQSVLGGRDQSAAHGFPRLLLYAFASYWRGMVAQSVGDVPLARSSFQVSVDVARSMGSHPTIAHPLAALGRLLALEGELDEARACLAESLTIHAANDDRWGLTQVMEGGALLALASGDAVRATKILAASDHLRALMGATLPPHEQRPRAELVATIRARTGDDAFDRAWTEGRAISVTRIPAEVLCGVSPEDADCDPPAAAAGASASADRTAAATHPEPRSASEAHDPSAFDLHVRALGPLAISVSGAVVEGGKWGSAKPRELLLYLLCHPVGVTREQIGLALWPDASTDRVSNSFHVTLHRLRRALGHPEWVVSAGDRYFLHADVRAYFDALAFERAVSDALRRPAGPTASTQVDARAGLDELAAALATYRGPFLEEEVVGDWHLDLRDRLARLHLEGQMALGAGLVAQKRWAEAADAYRRAVAADDLHEPAYRELMVCLARAGDRAQALRLYQRLVTLLADELDTRPEEETVALYEHLRSAEETT